MDVRVICLRVNQSQTNTAVSTSLVKYPMSTVDGRNPAPSKKPRGETTTLVGIYRVSERWCEMDFVRPQYGCLPGPSNSDSNMVNRLDFGVMSCLFNGWIEGPGAHVWGWLEEYV